MLEGYGLISTSIVGDIADAIRAKTGTAGTIAPINMATQIAAISGREDVSWHQCPEAVRNYLANVTYNSSDYTVSQIANYAPSTPVSANTKPVGQTVDGVTFYNEIPNADTPFATQNKAGTLNPLDQVRWLNTNAINARDIGGWACDGGTVRYGKLIRGGEPSALDIPVLVGEAGVGWELNLRGISEAQRTVTVLGDGVGYSVFDRYQMYSLTDTALWRDILRVVFDCVLNSVPCYFHCAAGADRTGTLALLIEGMLGVSQSDCDKDYELTCFYSGTGTDAQARRRNETEWTTLIGQINAMSGATFRDKCISFVVSLGFTADEINEFRRLMIDGTPGTVTPSISTYQVTKTLSHATATGASSATQYQPYEAELKPDNGYAISEISVTMGGVDITGSVFDGRQTMLRHSVSYNLTNCVATNRRSTVVSGQMFFDDFTAKTGYTMDGATISITMGGVSVATYYSEGKISIPSVTGDIVITISAAQQARENLLTMNDGNINKYIGSNGSPSNSNGYFVTDYFPVDLVANPGLRLANIVSHVDGLGTGEYGNCKMALCDENKTRLCQWYVSRNKTTGGNSLFTVDGSDLVNADIFANSHSTPQSGSVPSASAVKYIRLSLALNDASAAIASVADVIGSGIAIYAE